MRKFYLKVKSFGWVQHQCWLSPQARESIRRRSRADGVFERIIVMAALEIGLRQVTSSEIQRMNQRWHTMVGNPVRPLWAGAPHDPQNATDWRELNPARRRKKYRVAEERKALEERRKKKKEAA